MSGGPVRRFDLNANITFMNHLRRREVCKYGAILSVRSLWLFRLIAAIGLMVLPAFGHDLTGRYAASPLHDWFNHLSSAKGLCCSVADGYAVEDADWETKDGHYRVRVPRVANSEEAIWVDVPEEAVITEPNRAGRTMVWPIYSDQSVLVRCFLPGSMT
jgi:hypothetical protein